MKAKRVLASVISGLLIILMIVSLFPLTYVFRLQDHNNRIISGFYGEKENSLDMVYIGGSACFVYWEPLRAWNTYGFTSYNYAHDTITPQAVKYDMIEIAKTQSPKLWVIDLRPFQYGEEKIPEVDENIPVMECEVPLRNISDHMQYSQNRIDLINAHPVKWKDKIYYYWDFLKYRENWWQIAEEGIESIKTGDFSSFGSYKSTNTYKGFHFIPSTEEVHFVDYSNITEEKKLPESVDKLFLDTIKFCKDNNYNVLFVVHSYIQKESDKKEYNYMKRIIEKNGYGFLNANDYYKEVGLDYSFDMYNDNHVNIFGAEKYTDFLSKYIMEHYMLQDKRNDLEYAEWNTLYTEFSKKVDSTKKQVRALKE